VEGQTAVQRSGFLGLRAARNPRQLAGMAAEALSRYKLRTFLSILGVILGVAAVISMMSVSEGARREALRQVEMLGLNNIVVRGRGVAASESSRRSLTVSDARRLASLVPSANRVTPMTEQAVTVVAGGKTALTNLLGVEPS
jgi:putative ABC transport system permease protein